MALLDRAYFRISFFCDRVVLTVQCTVLYQSCGIWFVSLLSDCCDSDHALFLSLAGLYGKRVYANSGENCSPSRDLILLRLIVDL
jgi:hypothetical protein